MKGLKVGFEVEGITNSKVKNFPVGQYHEGLKIRGCYGWKAERDSSLERQGAFSEWGKAIEQITKILNGRKEYLKIIDNFINFWGCGGRYELSEVLSFNKSCGCHFHISLKEFCFEHKAIFKVFIMARRYLKKKIESSNIESKKEILKHYNREMAISIRFGENWRDDNGRYSEYNFDSEREGRGLELRGLNLLNIKSWGEFREILNIYYDVCVYLSKKATHYRDTENLKIDTAEFNNIGENSDLKAEVTTADLNLIVGGA